MIIDSHVHIIPNNINRIFEEFQRSSLDGINIICIKGLYEEKDILPIVKNYNDKNKRIFFTAGISLEDFKTDNIDKMQIEEFSFLKIHPRLQNLDIYSIYSIFHQLSIRGIKKPIIIDMFPYRTKNFFIKDNIPTNYEKLLNDFSGFPVVFAHFGGIYLREVFMMMKCYKNLYADTSLIARYFKDSPIEDELYYYINRLQGERVLYGSDYPELGLQESLDLQVYKMKKNGVKTEYINKVLGENFINLIDYK